MLILDEKIVENEESHHDDLSSAICTTEYSV